MADYNSADGLIHLHLPHQGLPSAEHNSLRVFALTLRGIGFAYSARDINLLFRILAGLAAFALPFISSAILTTFLSMTPIITGALASLTRPGTAAKPKQPKRANLTDSDDQDDYEDGVHALPMEQLGPADAIILPLMAGITLTGLYVLIKWLEDPALLSKILNWYFAFQGAFCTARLLTEMASILHDIAFPSAFLKQGQLFIVNTKDREYATASGELVSKSPLPGVLSSLPLPQALRTGLWRWRNLIQQRFNIRLYIPFLLTATLKIGPIGLVSSVGAITLSLWSNLAHTPWQLNNLFGYAFVHSSLQVMSPGTSTTGSLILTALFFYDIYFVFFTPIMVTVATQLDIPAKMYIPRADGFGIIGLGDLVIPGMVIAWALRFDLAMHYLRLTHSNRESANRQNGAASHESSLGESAGHDKNSQSNVSKPTYLPATGYWETRFWTTSRSLRGRLDRLKEIAVQGTSFPKPYFKATLIGYCTGMFVTTGVMTFMQHGQPALLYLVPGVLGALWLTAWQRDELGIMYHYVEGDDEDEGAASASKRKAKDEDEKGGKETKNASGFKSGLLSLLWEDDREAKKDTELAAKEGGESAEAMATDGQDGKGPEDGKRRRNKETEKETEKEKENVVPNWAKDQIFHLSARLLPSSERRLVLEGQKLVYQSR